MEQPAWTGVTWQTIVVLPAQGRDIVMARMDWGRDTRIGTARLIAMGLLSFAASVPANTCPVRRLTQDEALRGKFTGQRLDKGVNRITFYAPKSRELLDFYRGALVWDDVLACRVCWRRSAVLSHP